MATIIRSGLMLIIAVTCLSASGCAQLESLTATTLVPDKRSRVWDNPVRPADSSGRGLGVSDRARAIERSVGYD